MKIVSKSDVGRVRRSNQDSYAAGELPGGVGWAVVCDGMGGANGGNIASATAVKMISENISSSYREGMGANSIRTMLQSAVYAANVSIFDMAKSVDSLSGMGTTVVAAVLSDGYAHIVHAGDSRAYRIRGEEITQITKDHSIVQNMVENGQLTADEARYHPRKNVITRALGVEETLEVEYNEIELDGEDVLLICTDGLTNYLDTEDILQIIREHSFYDYPECMIAEANSNGGGDNITVVVITQ